MFLHRAACLAALAVALVQAEDASCDTPEEAVTLLQATNLAQAKSNSRGIPEVADADVHVDKHDGIKKLSGLLGQQSPDQAAAKEEFKKYDKDESGYLTRDEIVDMLKDNGGDASLEKADAVIAAYDQNGDHKLSFMEFLLALG
mmetsp:Transcript_15562/g.33209  ORF Transcript_15562/g.33209 Transcript_15562/m.33209 type:complete len:144 (-) Transcript_15562:136-567(-)